MVFVFGSNLAGRHGKGAAKDAVELWGAQYGQGVGRAGNSYAIPTKDKNLAPLSSGQIRAYILDFVEYAKKTPNEFFLLTPVGTGLAGHSKRDIWAILKEAGLPSNVALTSTWVTDS